MTPEEYTEKIKNVCGDNLVSVILYGSAAAGDYTGKQSDYNLLTVLNDLSLPYLKPLAGITAAWTRKGNPPPLLFSREHLLQSVDVFPIELLDMQQSHKVLFGDNILTDINISQDNLRLQIERELRTKLIALRENYLLAAAKPKALRRLMVNSLSTFLVLFRAALRLYDTEIPPGKIDAVRKLSERLNVSSEPFDVVFAIKQGKNTPLDAEKLFEQYLNTIISVVNAVDKQILQK